MNVVTRIKSIRDNGKGEALEKLVGGDLKFLKETTKVTNYYSKIMLLRNKQVRFEKTHRYQGLRELNRRFL